MLVNIKNAVLFSAAMSLSSLGFAAVAAPNVHLDANSTHTGLSIEQNQLTIEAMVLSISPAEPNAELSLLNNTHFSLSAGYAGDWVDQGYQLGQLYNQGQLSIYQGQTLLLSASFDQLQLLGQAQQNQGQVFADLNYLDGIWAQDLSTGRLEASFQQAANLTDLSQINNARFSGSLGQASAVPVPAAAYLFLTAAALLGFRLKRG